MTIIINSMSVINTSYTRCRWAICSSRRDDLVCVHLWAVRVQNEFFYFSARNQSPIINTQTNEQAKKICSAGAALPLSAPQHSPPLPLPVCTIQCHHTKVCLAAKLKSGYSSSPLVCRQHAMRLSENKKEKTQKSLKKRSEPRQNLQTPSSRPCDRVPAPGEAAGRSTPTALPPWQTLRSSRLHLYSGTVLNLTVLFP